MSGYFVDNAFPTVTGSVLSAASRVPVDTGLAQGASPQSGGIIPGTQPAPAAQIGLTALVGGAKAGATQLGYGANTVTTVASATDSCLLPPCFPGAMVILKNVPANSTTVFGFGTDTIDSIATATGNAQAGTKGKIYIGTSGDGLGGAGNWVSVLGA